MPNKIYKKVPLETLKRFIIHKAQELNAAHLTKVYELISGNTCLKETQDECVDIRRNPEAAHPCDPRSGPPFPAHPEKHPND
jgi:hypothetical protein